MKAHAVLASDGRIAMIQLRLSDAETALCMLKSMYKWDRLAEVEISGEQPSSWYNPHSSGSGHLSHRITFLSGHTRQETRLSWGGKDVKFFATGEPLVAVWDKEGESVVDSNFNCD